MGQRLAVRCDTADLLSGEDLAPVNVKRLVFVAKFWQVRQGKTFLVAGRRNKVPRVFPKGRRGTKTRLLQLPVTH